VTKRKIKGVIVSTEVILILSAVIVLAFIVSLGLGRMVMNQATSTKATATINEAHVWVYKKGSGCPFISVNVYVTNLGGKPIKINKIYILAGSSTNPTYITIQDNINKDVNPGETISISAYRYYSTYGCPSFPSGKTYILIDYSVSGDNNRVLTLGKPVQIEWVSG
jgi:hypothetical protein